MNFIKKGLIMASTAAMLFSLGACKKDYLDRVPTDRVASDSVFNDISGARAAIQGLNRHMFRIPSDPHHANYGQKSIDLMVDFMGDDIAWRDYSHNTNTINFSAALSGGAPVSYVWSFYYGMINNANIILANIDRVEALDEEKSVIKAQALTYRAWAYFYLVQFYQFPYPHHRNDLGVPIYTEPTREGKARASVEEVYAQIEADLKDAIDLFAGVPDPRHHISDINISVTQAIMARVYLTKYDFAKAAQYAQDARAGYSLMNASQLLSGFNLSNGEWIWGSSLNDEQTSAVVSFTSHIIYDAKGYAYIHSPVLINRNLYRSDIDEDDIRKEWWYAQAKGGIPQYTQNKFKVRTPGSSATDLPYIRASEMYLIEAESKAILGDIAGAEEALETLIGIRIPGYTMEYSDPALSDQDKIIELVKEIALQRRVEFWGEGLRWLDIKRYLYYGPVNNRIPGGLVIFQENELGVHREFAGGNTGVWGGSQNAVVSPFLSGQPNPRFRVQIPGGEFEYNPRMVRNE